MQESNQRRLVRFTGHTPQLLTDPEYIRSVIPTLNPEFDMRSLSDRDILKREKNYIKKSLSKV